MSSLYIDNILIRLNRYKKEVVLKEVLVDKSWILWDEQKNQHQYLFTRDRRIILSFNGKVEEGKWEILPSNQIYINKESGKLLLNFELLFNSVILILKISGPNNEPFVLYDENKVRNGDLLGYIDEYEKNQKLNVGEKITTESGQSEIENFALIGFWCIVIFSVLLLIIGNSK